MIEDEKLGLKIAQTPEEEILHLTKENMEKRILNSELQIDIDKHVLEYIKEKLKPFSKS